MQCNLHALPPKGGFPGWCAAGIWTPNTDAVSRVAGLALQDGALALRDVLGSEARVQPSRDQLVIDISLLHGQKT